MACPILVTGACGRLGGKVVRKLVGEGRHVLATDRAPCPAEPKAVWGGPCDKYVEFAQCELTDSDAINSLVRRAGDIIHVGAIPGPSHEVPPGVDPGWATKATIGLEKIAGLELLKQNLIGTCNLFEAASRCGNGRRIVFSSSLFAMGWSHDPHSFLPEYIPLDEHHPPLPLEHYGLSKAMAESFAQMLARAGLDSTEGPNLKRARHFGESPSFVMLRFSNIIKEECWEEFPKPFNEEVTPLMWAYCHELDVVDAHLLALNASTNSLPSTCESFFIVADDTRYVVPTRELIKQHWDPAKQPARTMPFISQSLSGYASIVSNQKAKQLLGFKPRTCRKLTAPPSNRKMHSFPVPSSFELKSGEILADDAFLAYNTYGSLAPDKSNVILFPTSFDATHWELEFYVGPGRMLDTDKYFVIIVNLLGNGVSYSPSTCTPPATFPSQHVSMCDNVRLQALLLDSLSIDTIQLIYGYSMGAMQALHWGVMFPNRVLRIMAVCGSAKASDYNVVFLDSLKEALFTDQDIKQNHHGRLFLSGPCSKGLKAFARIYAGWGVPMEFYREEAWRRSSKDGLPFTSREDFVVRSYEGGFANSHPLNLLAQVGTWKSADVSTAKGLPGGVKLKEALSKITARVYFLPCTTDRYFTVDEIEEEASWVPNCHFEPIKSIWGHRAGDPHRPGQESDEAFLQEKVKDLLKENP